jgi:hypothetical protein
VDLRDREIERFRTWVAELTRRNELLQEALRRVQVEANRQGSRAPQSTRTAHFSTQTL